MTLHRYIALLFVSALLLASCSNTRHLPAGDSLFLGGKVKIEDNEASGDERGVIKEDLEDAVRPKHNSTVLGIRFKLWIYNRAGTPKKPKGLRASIRKAGEPPVLTSGFNANTNQQIFVNMLNNRGFFYPSVSVELKTKRKKSRAYFTVKTGPQYKIRKVEFVMDSSMASRDMMGTQTQSLLVVGKSYNLDVIKGERERIDKALKEKGYYYFRSDYIIVKTDTSIGNHEVNMYVTLKKDEIPDQAYRVYTIHDVFVYPNYRLNGQQADTNKANATFYKGYYVVDVRKTYKPFVFSQAMQFSPGDVYNRTDHNASLNRIVSLGTFKFVKNRFEQFDSTGDWLDVYYYLTPFPKKSIRFEIGALSQNDSRAGSQASISWRNRNTFKGAELLQVKLSGGFEAQYSGAVHQPNTYQAGLDVSLNLPRFAVPVFTIPSSSVFIPHTIIKAGYSLETRDQLFHIQSVKGSYGYDWREDVRKQHQLYPLNVTYVRTDTLGSTENLNLNYSNLVFNGFIIGPSYEFTYNTQAGSARKSNFYFDGLADLSGGFAGLDHRANYKDAPSNFLGTPFSQYLKFQADLRHYFNFSKKASWVNRVMVGVGVPYGSSSSLPNIKQFFSGGNSSLRGFRSRLAGPGTYNEEYLTGKQTYIELLGDLKLELNSEIRTNIFQFIKGAAFFDAGNIWLYNDNPNFPGGKLTSNFYKELAADVGVGLRFDFKIVLLRLDLGMPVRKPWLPEGERWVFNKINFKDGNWRANNLILNIAIGFPF
jgi:outer membrane protein insertion porin family